MPLKNLFKKLPSSKKFNEDIIWNIFSFGIGGICIILLNILIAKYYGTATLGMFNQSYAIYIFFSQIAVWGIHASVLKNIAQFSNNIEESNIIINAGFISTICVSVIVISIAFFLKDFLSTALGSEDVGSGLSYILWGIVFFSLNKVLLAYHNGYRRMKAFAVFQSLRFIFLLAYLIVFISFSLENNKITAIFPFSECTLLLILFVYSLNFFQIIISKKVFLWIKKHLIFGSQAVIGNISAGANTRVDVIMLGLFTRDAIVGIYSFAAMIAEGFSQFAIIFKTNVNPILTKYKFEKGNLQLQDAVCRGRNLFYKMIIPLGIASIVCFPVMLQLLKLKAEFSPAWGLYSILISMYLIAAGYMPFKMILNQTGYPGQQSFLVFSIFITNIILNAVLIPVLGMHGAAIATGLSFIAGVLFLKIIVKHKLQISI